MTEQASRPRRRARRSPLPVISAALASFLVVLALLSARVFTGAGQPLSQGPRAQVVSRTAHTILRTTASGRTIVEPAPAGGGEAAASAAGAQAPAALTTRASGGEGDG